MPTAIRTVVATSGNSLLTSQLRSAVTGAGPLTAAPGTGWDQPDTLRHYPAQAAAPPGVKISLPGPAHASRSLTAPDRLPYSEHAVVDAPQLRRERHVIDHGKRGAHLTMVAGGMRPRRVPRTE